MQVRICPSLVMAPIMEENRVFQFGARKPAESSSSPESDEYEGDHGDPEWGEVT
jgi:hypothetical protein